MYFVYAISSISKNYIYIGFTKDLDDRLNRHNKGYEKTTKPYLPFVLIFEEECISRFDARKREKFWKTGIGRERLRNMKIAFAGLSNDR
jgi:putative endonuclease